MHSSSLQACLVVVQHANCSCGSHCFETPPCALSASFACNTALCNKGRGSVLLTWCLLTCCAVWWGFGSGIVVSLIFGGSFAAVFYVAKTMLFTGAGQAIFQGVVSWVASILITYLAFKMLKFSNIEEKYKRKFSSVAEVVSVLEC